MKPLSSFFEWRKLTVRLRESRVRLAALDVVQARNGLGHERQLARVVVRALMAQLDPIRLGVERFPQRDIVRKRIRRHLEPAVWLSTEAIVCGVRKSTRCFLHALRKEVGHFLRAGRLDRQTRSGSDADARSTSALPIPGRRAAASSSLRQNARWLALMRRASQTWIV